MIATPSALGPPSGAPESSDDSGLVEALTETPAAVPASRAASTSDDPGAGLPVGRYALLGMLGAVLLGALGALGLWRTRKDVP